MGRSVAQVAVTTHLKPTIVEALEADNYRALIAPTYAKGFYRLYCEYLGLDPAPYVDAYMEHYQQRRHASHGRGKGIFGKLFGKKDDEEAASPFHPSHADPPPTHSEPRPLGQEEMAASSADLEPSPFAPDTDSPTQPAFDFAAAEGVDDLADVSGEANASPLPQEAAEIPAPEESEAAANPAEVGLAGGDDNAVPEEALAPADEEVAPMATGLMAVAPEAREADAPPVPVPAFGTGSSRRQKPKTPTEIAREVAQRAAQRRAAMERELAELQKAC